MPGFGPDSKKGQKLRLDMLAQDAQGLCKSTNGRFCGITMCVKYATDLHVYLGASVRVTCKCFWRALFYCTPIDTVLLGDYFDYF